MFLSVSFRIVAHIAFENFGKIKEGHINISNLSIFVGENNSGKTYVMQLIYAVINEICQEKVFSDNILDDKYESDFERVKAYGRSGMDNEKQDSLSSLFAGLLKKHFIDQLILRNCGLK